MASPSSFKLKSPYFLGCPVWNCPAWISTVFSPKTKSKDLLKNYARIFNAVEGNSTFYAIPQMPTVERWMAETGDNFQFCLKFPKSITHDRRLIGTHQETLEFLKLLEAFQDGNRLGACFLQLSPSFNINNIHVLEAYLKNLPVDFKYAVEPRHISFFDDGDNERTLNELLRDMKVDRVTFDSRPLFSVKEKDSHELDAASRKPQLPVRHSETNSTPFLRFVASNKIELNDPWINEWVPIINKWILEEKRPYVMVHAADEAYAPFVAKRLHQRLQKLNPLIPNLSGFYNPDSDEPQLQEQLDLF
ncbi:DUF72 domain-containing protein [Puniceicoccaceae bacterium K14]|nr:DUF72 domain-containing protein [Puniceicoccaceae bacterium K14]